MAKLTDDERKQREQARKAALSLKVKAAWQEQLELSKAVMSSAAAAWDNAFSKKELNLRHLWLVLAVFETEERIQASGLSESCKSKWFDKIAPRAKGTSTFRGLAGFTTRMANTAPLFLKLSGNGYVYTTNQGRALVQHLRKLHPELRVGAPAPHSYQTWEILGLRELPAPRWRDWTDWVPA